MGTLTCANNLNKSEFAFLPTRSTKMGNTSSSHITDKIAALFKNLDMASLHSFLDFNPTTEQEALLKANGLSVIEFAVTNHNVCISKSMKNLVNQIQKDPSLISLIYQQLMDYTLGCPGSDGTLATTCADKYGQVCLDVTSEAFQTLLQAIDEHVEGNVVLYGGYVLK